MNPPVVTVVGPTGAGKSELAIDLALRFHGEVINCDSVQVYREFEIGSAKLPAAERARVPHHLFDIRNPDELYTAGEFARDARALIAEITARGRLPVLCGGTGFYLRALFRGLSPGPERDDVLRARLVRRGPARLHRLLARLDPEAGRRIHPNDTNKTLRALEIRLLTRRPAADLFADGLDALTGYTVLQLGLDPPRQALYSKLNDRCVRMWDGGLFEETQTLLARWPATAKPFASLGYRQAVLYSEGALTREAAIADMQARTRQYAKRQWTWFRAENDVKWLPGFGGDAAVKSRAALEFSRLT